MNSTQMIFDRGGPEDTSVVGELRTHVFMNNMEATLVTLDAIRAEHPYGFDCRDSLDRTALEASCELQVSPEIMRVLLQPENRMYGGHPNDQYGYVDDETALFKCVMCDRKHKTLMHREEAVIKVKMLLECGANVSLSVHCDWIPLHKVGSMEMVKVLFKYGAEADINRMDWVGRTALMFSVQRGDIPISNFLLEHGADMSI